MKLNREGVQLNAEERNKRNQNWATLEVELDGIGEKIAVSGDAKELAENVQAQVNALVVQGDSSVEARQARVDAKGVEAATLKARLDAEQNAVTQQLADKAEKDKVRESTDIQPINVSEMDTETKALFTGGSVAVVGVDAVGTENVKSKAITTDKTDFITSVEVGTEDVNINNLFTEVGSISPTNGVLAAGSTTYKSTPFISLEGIKKIFRYVTDGASSGVFTAYHAAFYDATGTFISGIPSGTAYTVEQYKTFYGRDYPFPTGAKQIRLSCLANNLEGGTGSIHNYLMVKSLKKNQLKDDVNLTLIDQKVSAKVSETVPTTVESYLAANGKLKGKVVAFFGDSIFGNFRDATSIPNVFARETGATVKNFGFGGSRMAGRNDSNSQAQYWDKFSMARIADYIASGDFTPMETALPDMSSALSYFQETIDLLKAQNWLEIDYAVFEHGTNDFTGQNVIYNETDPADIYSYKGAYRHVIETLLTAYPHIKIIIFTPTWRFWHTNGVYDYDSDTHVIADQTLPQFVEAAKEIAKEYHYPAIDNYYELGANKFTRTQFFSPTDGTHHFENGREIYGVRSASAVMAVI